MWCLNGSLGCLQVPRTEMVIMKAVTDGSRKTRKVNSNTDDIYCSKVEPTTSQLPMEPSSLLNTETADWLFPHVRSRLTHGGPTYIYSSRNVLS